MKTLGVFAVIAACCYPAAQSHSTAGDAKIEAAQAQVRKVQQGIVDAFGKGSKALGAYLGPLLADNSLITDTDGRLYNKIRFIAMAKSGDREPMAVEQKDTKVVVHGDTAVVTSLVAKKGLPKEVYRMTNVFVRTENQWRILVMQLTTVSRP